MSEYCLGGRPFVELHNCSKLLAGLLLVACNFTAAGPPHIVDEGLYFDVPTNEVAYNVQIICLGLAGYATVYHGEPMKSINKPGDSVKVAVESGRFRCKMPTERRFAIHGDPLDTLSSLYSAADMWGGAGNPVTIKGKEPDAYFYVFFLAVTDDDRNWQGEDFRHSLCQARTLDFHDFELRARVDGRVDWKPFRTDSPPEWKRPWLLRDTTGERICSRQPTGFPNTQGLIGSICFHGNAYYFFYTDRDTDGKTYLYYRTCPDLTALHEERTAWSVAKRISDPVTTGTVIRVAKVRDRSRWAVLYNGYHEGPKGMRQDLFLQYTGDLSIDGTNGLAGVRWFDRAVSDCGISSAFLGLKSGGGIFAQHDFLTDPYGALAVPDGDDNRPQVGGLLTWADFTRGVYGGQVYWARWQEPPR